MLSLVTAVIAADGQVTAEERELFELMVENIGLEESVVHRYRCLLASREPADLGELVRNAATGNIPDETAGLVREAYLVAFADGEVEARERDVIDRFLVEAQIPTERRGAIHAWGRMAVEHARLGRALFVPGA